MTSGPEFEHFARIAYAGIDHGLVSQQWVRGLSAPLLEEVIPHFESRERAYVRWVDFRCDSAGECGYLQTFGGNPQRRCGDTYVAIDAYPARYSFLKSSEIIEDPSLITPWCADGLRKVQYSDTPHPPFPRSRSDEIAAVMAKLPLAVTVSQEVMNRADAMMKTLEDAIKRKNGEIV
jgi:hypothetical protein